MAKAGLSILKFIGAVLIVLSTAGLATIEWGGYQRETDLRAALVGDVNTSIAQVSVSANLIATGAVGIEKSGNLNIPLVKNEYNDVKGEWEQDAARIRGQLEAYYVQPGLERRWHEYASVVSDFLLLSYPKPQNGGSLHVRRQAESRRLAMEDIEQYLGKGGTTLQRSLKKTILKHPKDVDAYSHAYEVLGDMFSKARARINEDILSRETRAAPPFGIVRLLQRHL